MDTNHRKDTDLSGWAKSHGRETINLIRRMVEMESPSDDQAALSSFASWFAEMATREFGASVELAAGGHLVCTFDSGLSSDATDQLLVLGHYDTVWPVGTLARIPFAEHDGRLWGPGVLDMKGGIAIALMAIRALQELNIKVNKRVLLQLNSDEEIGSRTSRELTESNAARSKAVFVVEPGTGLSGKLKTARKGVGEYRIQVTGRAAHAGVDFQAGASAVLELAHQLIRIAEFTNLERGVTVNAGVISGGTRSNVIPAEAKANIDIRIARMADAAELSAKFEALTPVDERCAITVHGGLNRPPMERSDGIVALFEMARSLAREIGVELEESSTGGGSDGNFTAALGIPTLDGIGAVGEGAHATNESILVDRIADRTALLAMLLSTV